jgi:hypothetical protein
MSDFNDEVLQNVADGLQMNGLEASASASAGGVGIVKLDWGDEDGLNDESASKHRWYGGEEDGTSGGSAVFERLQRDVVFDVILAADCCYEPDHPRLLCRFPHHAFSCAFFPRKNTVVVNV